jgi:hypothetical protein
MCSLYFTEEVTVVDQIVWYFISVCIGSWIFVIILYSCDYTINIYVYFTQYFCDDIKIIENKNLSFNSYIIGHRLCELLLVHLTYKVMYCNGFVFVVTLSNCLDVVYTLLNL